MPEGLHGQESGKKVLCPELKACPEFLDTCDTLVVSSLDRYGRSLQDLINFVAELCERGIGFTSRHENLDTTTRRRPTRLRVRR
ncbi:recombinase family protein [Streptomyces sp. NPDC057199]|uniref:recombinase family protein n=1 Tax=Streptomyces sp. NPDC057199 TaxID=3346047 RepID=UPI003626330F